MYSPEPVWCESVGPVDPTPLEEPAYIRARIASISRTPMSTKDDIDPDLVPWLDEEEPQSIDRLVWGMSPPNYYRSLSMDSEPDQSAKIQRTQSTPSRKSSEYFETGNSPPLHGRTPESVLSSTSCSLQTRSNMHQGYGALENSRLHGYAYLSNGYSINSEIEDTLRSHQYHKQRDDGIQKLPFFMISLTMMFIGASSRFHSTLVDQYVYQRYAIDIIGNTTHTASDPCFHGPEENKSQTALVDQVQSLSSQKLLYLDLTVYGLGIPSCIILGMLSRSVGRRLQLFIPLFGYTFKCAGVVALVNLNPNLNWFFLPYVIEGLTGTYVGVLLGLFLYTSDITGRTRSRTTAMVILEGVRGATTAALYIVVGEMIQDSGFKLPAWLSLAAAAVAILVVFMLPNRKPLMKSSKANQIKAEYANIQDSDTPIRRSLLSMFIFPAGTFDNPNIRKMFISALTAAFLLLIALLGIKKVQSLYLMDEPICWSSSMIGWFSFAGEMSSNLFTILIGPQLIRCFPGMTIGVVGMLSLTGGCVFLAFATRGFQLFFQPLVNVAQQLPMGLIRGELSRLVGHEAQGTLFATIAVMESCGFAVGANFLYVYNSTLGVYKGAVELLGAGVFFIAAWILVYFQRIWLRHNEDSAGLKKTVRRPAERIGSYQGE